MRKLALGAILLAAAVAFGGAGEILQPYIDSGALPGAIAVWEKPGMRETTLAGWADAANRVPIAMDQAFMQCSQTKGFCGVTVAILVEEGKISLDDPVAKYIPGFTNLFLRVEKPDGSIEKRPLQNAPTIRMIMNHTAGFTFETPSKTCGGWGAVSLEETAEEAIEYGVVFEPGTAVRYSNTGIDIGARIVEIATGEKWEDFLKRRVLDPLEMRDTWFWPTDAQIAGRIKFYGLRKKLPAVEAVFDHRLRAPWNGPQVFASAGAGLWTTARDQLKFYRMLMNLGLGDNGVRILKEETVRKLLASSTRPDGMEGYSLGLQAEGEWFGHGGAWGTNCMVNPEKKFLALWVVQLRGGPRPWDAAIEEGKRRFFAAPVDSGSEYTGRLK